MRHVYKLENCGKQQGVMPLLVCYTAVFSVITQRSFPGRALRDDTKNGCVADYPAIGVGKISDTYL